MRRQRRRKGDMENAVEEVSKPTWLELETVIPLETTQPGITTVKSLTTLSADTVEREFGDMIIQLSPRRRGMKLRHALKIAAGIKS
jgi:hypothetical protein